MMLYVLHCDAIIVGLIGTIDLSPFDSAITLNVTGPAQYTGV